MAFKICFMGLTDYFIFILVYAAWLGFAARRVMTYLHLLQQDDYDASRFLRLILERRVFDKRLSAALLLITIVLIFSVFKFFIPAWAAFSCVAGAFTCFTSLEKDPRRAAKKKLVMTQRARRIFIVSLMLCALLGTFWFLLPLPFFWIICVQAIPLAIVLANTVLQPFEAAIRQKYWREAHERLKTVNPVVIGITGSFGKTSVKHILGHILKTFAPTLITPGSVNTVMGISRIIREQLQDNHKYFIAEMGAYGPGSIERLCALTPPDIGIITAIGAAHYERFKTLDTVAEAKFELAEAVLRKNGHVVFPKTLEAFSHVRKVVEKSPGSFLICGNPDFILQSARQDPDGLAIEILWRGESRQIRAPLYGLQHGSNIALAYGAAALLGVPLDHIETALRSVPQIEHRLQVKPQADGRIYIDDAFNSNPQGFAAALDLLETFAGRRKILITPGMVELGSAHEAEHEIIGRKAGKTCDIVLAVKADRIPSFITGFHATGGSKQILEMESFAAAHAWIDQNSTANDVILIENDLPDLYENVPRF